MKLTNEMRAIGETSKAREDTDHFEPLLDCRDAARHVQCHKKTLQRYGRKGTIRAYRIHHRWYFRVSELDCWVQSQVNSECHRAA
jgi:hypothetical protein